MPAIVVNISGATRSGKGTLVKSLLLQLLGPRSLDLTNGQLMKGAVRYCSSYGQPPVVVSCICQDDFFDLANVKLLGNTYDCPEALNHDQMLQTLVREMNDPQVTWVLIEGFMSFYDDRLFNLCTVPIWLEVPFAISKDRRMRTKRVEETYFDANIWSNHLAYAQRVFSRPMIQTRVGVIDGTLSVTVVLNTAMGFLTQFGGLDAMNILQTSAIARKEATKLSVMYALPDYSFRRFPPRKRLRT